MKISTFIKGISGIFFILFLIESTSELQNILVLFFVCIHNVLHSSLFTSVQLLFPFKQIIKITICVILMLEYRDILS